MAPLTGRAPKRRATFSFMEVLVIVAIVLVLAALAVPLYQALQLSTAKGTALANLRAVTQGVADYAKEHDGALPAEDAKGGNSWEAATAPESAQTWYNAVPRLLGKKSVGDYASQPRAFYTPENVLFLPAAGYPASDKKLVAPLFALAINSKLQRKDIEGRKTPVKLSEIKNPARTVLFLEQGIHGEPKAMAQQPKYDGSPKGSARSFVARYGGQGILTFCDGHAETVSATDLLTETGKIPFPQTDLIWTRTAEEDPNN
ncbi:MAG: hypothetical protein QOE70_2143 [Chthoniobacter sp.]|jgi:prepilin-type processing-associated H-X9-DG protein|nr:hypothetical protein [Chthoniobacter sp.]